MIFSAYSALLGKESVGRLLTWLQFKLWVLPSEVFTFPGRNSYNSSAVYLVTSGLGTLGQVFPFLKLRLVDGSMVNISKISKNRSINIERKFNASDMVWWLFIINLIIWRSISRSRKFKSRKTWLSSKDNSLPITSLWRINFHRICRR